MGIVLKRRKHGHTLSKLRPVVVLAFAGRDDWILCQVTSNPYSDPAAIRISDSDFEAGSLQRVSYARPGKLFTANSSLIITEAGRLNAMAFNNIINAIVDILQKAVKK
ncbi:MAG: type II toxin-antitoxin system PemK/MazF family toxin [Deltaproteobacteria bacterium]|nr:type II toxin-antitoxin system PemK/MazF family toxin [Deltaproteobacteria bacterium]